MREELGSLDVEGLTDAELSRAYCGGCHLYPAPSLLPKKAWEKVLPHMGNRLGIATGVDPYMDKSMREAMRLKSAGIFPEEPLLSDSTWRRLVAYFLEQAPDSLPGNDSVDVESFWNTLFKPSFPKVNFSGPPGLTMVHIDETRQKLYLANANNFLVRLGSSFDLEDHTKLMSPATAMIRSHDRDEILLTSIGIMFPNDHEVGVISRINDSSGWSAPEILIDKLARPVFFDQADLDQDGLSDLIVCSFGNALGRLSWFKKTADGYNGKVIKEVPGAVTVHLEDMDGDGVVDLVVLFAQGDEGISVFYNTGGTFVERRLLRFDPLFGSSDMEVKDVNGDSHQDIIVANGDNGDYSNVLKPYHGVRVFLNDGDSNFRESYFYPMNGASRVVANDFDLDGDIDLFASSFFPNYDQLLSGGLVYLENKGDMIFKPSYFDQAGDGRWMVLDAGDLDQDGDQDIVVGSFSYLSTGVPKNKYQQWKSSSRHILFLENTAIK